MSENVEKQKFGLSAVLLTSVNATKSVDFYQKILGVPLMEETHGGGTPHHACKEGKVHFTIQDKDALKKQYTFLKHFDLDSIHLFYTVENMDEFLNKCESQDVERISDVARLGPMKVVMIKDPDGRKILVGTPWQE